ncbi:MAG: MFS transporter [Alphaproteobacteria bacterium]|nr:MFS transporter [Alphaproteobacteria bacterium]
MRDEGEPQVAPIASDTHQFSRLMVFFALVYIVEGLGQTGGLISQPLNYFLKERYGWSPVEVTAYLTVLNFPWVIKPVYGIVSDFIPLFGYRRKAYLVIANAAAAAAYFWVASSTAPGEILLGLLLTAYAMAASSTLSGAVLVENGQRFGASDTFVNQEWLWFNVAAIASALLGGLLVEHLSAAGALHTAALIVGVAPFLAVFGTLFLISEERSRADLAQLKATFRGLLTSLRRRELWLIGGFLFLYYFNPGFGTPLYYYMTDELRFSQQFIGLLGAVSSAGWVAGALIYRWALRGMTSRALLYLSIIYGTVATLLFLLLADPIAAVIVNFAAGVAGMISMVATLTLAADFAPQRAEGFTYAALLSLTNLAMSLGDNVGSLLFEHVFGNRLAPLIIVSAAATAVIVIFVPLLRLGGKRHGKAAARA